MTQAGPPADTLADVIRRLRGEDKAKPFAERVGLGPSTISHIEAGSRSISVGTVEQIGKALGLSKSEMAALRAARDRTSASLNSRASTPEELSRLDQLEDDMEELRTAIRELQESLLAHQHRGDGSAEVAR